MSEWTQEEVQDVLGEVARRATVDREFRAMALADAAQAIARINPKPLPPDFSVQFVDNSGAKKTIPLPDPIPGLSEEPVDLMPGAGPTNVIFIGINFPDNAIHEGAAREAREAEQQLAAS